MPADTDPATTLHRIRDLAESAREAQPEAMRKILDEIAALASRPIGDTAETSDVPQTENQSL